MAALGTAAVMSPEASSRPSPARWHWPAGVGPRHTSSWSVGWAKLAMAAARLLAPTARRRRPHWRRPRPIAGIAGIDDRRGAGRLGPRGAGWQQLATWNLANALVIAGTLAAAPGVAPGVVPGVAGGFAVDRRCRWPRLRRGPGAWLGTARPRTLPRRPRTRGAYRAVLALLALSIPVGLAAHPPPQRALTAAAICSRPCSSSGRVVPKLSRAWVCGAAPNGTPGLSATLASRSSHSLGSSSNSRARGSRATADRCPRSRWCARPAYSPPRRPRACGAPRASPAPPRATRRPPGRPRCPPASRRSSCRAAPSRGSPSHRSRSPGADVMT
jgi:hypothetical protein